MARFLACSSIRAKYAPRSRVLVEKKIYTKFVEAMTEKAKRFKLGPPLDCGTKMGPLVGKEQYDRAVLYLSESQMTEMDRNLETSAEPSILERATMAGIEFDKGNWSYEQLACQALPGYVFLLFQENNGAGDRSFFSAAIPRNGEGRVRIIPIQRRGYSLFSPAPVNALAIATFNHLRADEPARKPADWLSTALCYAALTGGHPDTSPLAKKSADANLGLSFPPTIEVESDGGAIIRFVDASTARQPMQWALTFSSTGKLLKVARSATPLYAVKLLSAMSDRRAGNTKFQVGQCDSTRELQMRQTRDGRNLNSTSA